MTAFLTRAHVFINTLKTAKEMEVLLEDKNIQPPK